MSYPVTLNALNLKPNKLTLALLATGLTTSLLAGHATAAETVEANSVNQESAQQKLTKQEAAVETISITGYRRSLIDSINTKRFSDTISEQISADDLGALPDVSMSDALTRLPGISAVRTNGQSGEINIRGLSGGFVSTTLNGREQVSTKGERNVEFDQYPSELITSAAVYKSPKASLLEGGVAGTVELKTASPLAIKEAYKLNANIRLMTNDRADEVYGAPSTGNRLSFSYQGKFLQDTLGVAVGYARLYQPSASTQFVGLKYDVSKDVDLDSSELDAEEIARDAALAQGLTYDDCPISCERVSEGFELQHKGGEETRTGYMAVIEYAPHDAFTLKADFFKSTFDSEEFARGFRVKLDAENASYANLNKVNDQYIVGGTFKRLSNGSNTRIETSNDNNNKLNNITSYGINADWHVTDNLKVNVDISHSQASSDFKNGLLWALVAEDANVENPVVDSNVAISYQLNGLNLPDIGFNQADKLTDLNHMLVSKYGIYPYVYSDKLDAARFDFTYNLDTPFITSIEAGVRWSERTYTADRSVYEYGSDSSFLTKQPPLKLTDDMVEVVDWQGEFSYFPSYLAIDLDKALNAWFPQGTPQPVKTWGNASGILNKDEITATSDYSWSMVQSGEVYEDIFAAYIMANLEFDLFDIPVTGNFGVRMVESDQAATELKNVDGDIKAGAQYVTDDAGLVNDQYALGVTGITYRDYLPQLNLNFKITDNDYIRVAAADVMSRPPINRLSAQTSYNIDSTTGHVSGENKNNPALTPFYATQYDISYERYFEDANGSLAIAYFYKDIESAGIQNITLENFDFAGYGLPIPEVIFNNNGVPVTTVNKNFELALNDQQGGYLQGIEISYTQVFTELPELFSGLGVNISYSYTDSEISQQTNLDGDTFETSLPGLSKNLLNATVFWAYKDFETRLNLRQRSEFVSDQSAIDSQLVNYDAESVLDYQASYQFNDHLSVLFQANNLTDEPTKTYFGTSAQTGTIQYFGRQFYLGVNFTL